MSHVVRKTAFCICEKDADQLRGNHEADHGLCFRNTDSTIPLLSKSKIKALTIFCDCKARFVSDLMPETRRPSFLQIVQIILLYDSI